MQRILSYLAPLSIGLLLVYVLYDQSTRTKTKEPESVLEPIVTMESMQPFLAVSYDLPAKISFAGEDAPLELPDVMERLDRELQVNIYLQSSTLFLLKRANRWLPRITEILKANNIPEDFKYLPLIESGLVNGVSPKNAVGYWQILEAPRVKNWALKLPERWINATILLNQPKRHANTLRRHMKNLVTGRW
jgi:membrane-bound lytic murein transglycosylase D